MGNQAFKNTEQNAPTFSCSVVSMYSLFIIGTSAAVICARKGAISPPEKQERGT